MIYLFKSVYRFITCWITTANCSISLDVVSSIYASWTPLNAPPVSCISWLVVFNSSLILNLNKIVDYWYLGLLLLRLGYNWKFGIDSSVYNLFSTWNFIRLQRGQFLSFFFPCTRKYLKLQPPCRHGSYTW